MTELKIMAFELGSLKLNIFNIIQIKKAPINKIAKGPNQKFEKI